MFSKDFPGDSAVKNLLAVQKIWVQSVGWEDPLEEVTGKSGEILIRPKKVLPLVGGPPDGRNVPGHFVTCGSVPRQPGRSPQHYRKS